MGLEPYAWVKWLHVLSSAVMFGGALGSALHFWFAHRGRRMRVVATVARNVVKTDRWVILPAAIVQLVTGLGLAVAASIPLDVPWLVVSYGLYLAAFRLWLSAATVQTRVREFALEAAGGAPLRYEYRGGMRRWVVLVWPMLGAMVLIFLLMTVRPTLW